MYSIIELRSAIDSFRKHHVSVGSAIVSFEDVENFLYYNDDLFGLIYIIIETIHHVKIRIQFDYWPGDATKWRKFNILGIIINDQEFEKIKKNFQVFPQEVLFEEGSLTKGVR